MTTDDHQTDPHESRFSGQPFPPDIDGNGASPSAHDGSCSDVIPESRSFQNIDDDFGLTAKPRTTTKLIDPVLGTDLGGFIIKRLIGEGGMGRVYEARQQNLGRTVAVKVIRVGLISEKTVRRFEREAEFLAKVQHPGIAQIFLVGTYTSDFGEVPFYVMEFIENAKPITNYVHEQNLSHIDRLKLFKQVCDAVSHGHDRGVVHRDLKPGNILIDSNGRPKIIDFGVARSTDSDLQITNMKTDTGQMIGTVQYMAPEQFGDNPDDLDTRVDVYSLGVVLYEILAGVLPYDVRRKGIHEAARIVCEKPPLPLRTQDKTIPSEVSAIVEQCLQKDRRSRYYTAGELAADLGRFLDGKSVKAKPSTLIGRLFSPRLLRKLVSRRTGLVLISAGILAVGFNKLVTSRLLDFEMYWPETAQLKASAAWTPTSLSVRKGEFYRLTAAGSCKDTSGLVFGPEGTAPEGLRNPFDPPSDIAKDAVRNAFVDGLPRRMLLARIHESRFVLPVGTSLAFVAPWTGDINFRVNHETESPTAVTGHFHMTLERIVRPPLVDKDGKTTISTRVDNTKYLLFEPEGIRWQCSQLDLGKVADSPTLINGIAWWPRPDRRDTEGWLEFNLTSRTPLLKTQDFAWAADPKGPKPRVTKVLPTGDVAFVTAEGPSPEQAGLMFATSSPMTRRIECEIHRAR